MPLHDKINKFIKEKGMNRKEFAIKLINLKPTINRVGEIPSVSAIYAYWSGTSSIKAELIPYIAEALNITEQELFDTSAKTRKKCFKYFLENASKDELEYFNRFINTQIDNNININYGNVIMTTKNQNEKVEELVQLLEYAPTKFVDNVLDKLHKFKRITNDVKDDENYQ